MDWYVSDLAARLVLICVDIDYMDKYKVFVFAVSQKRFETMLMITCCLDSP